MTPRRPLLGALLCVLGLLAPAFAGLITQSGPRLVVSDSDWQLPAANYRESIHTFALGYPRVNCATVAWAYHCRAPSTLDRDIPLGIMGGCPPWHVTINSGPPGMSVSATYVLEIPAVTVGSWTIDLTIEDQCGNTPLEPSWTFEGISLDNTTYFAHVTGGAAGGGTGTSGSPYDSLEDVIGPISGTSTHVGKQVIVCGTLTLSGLTAGYGSNNSKLVVNANKPHVYVACDSGATFQGSAGNSDGSNFNASAGGNFAFVGIAWDNPKVDEQAGAGDPGLRNVFIHASSSTLADGLIYDNTFDCTSDADAADGGSNPAAIFESSGGTGTHTLITGNTFDNCDHMTYVMWFDATFQLVQFNTVTNSSVTEGFFMKGGLALTDFFFYGNTVSNSAAFVYIMAINDDGPWSRERIELMHNTVQATEFVDLDGEDTDSTYSVYAKRNSFKGTALYDIHDVKAGDIVSSTWNAIETADADGITNAGTVTPISTDNEIGASGILDDATMLLDDRSTPPLCQVGAEICSSALIPANDDVFERRLAA